MLLLFVRSDSWWIFANSGFCLLSSLLRFLYLVCIFLSLSLSCYTSFGKIKRETSGCGVEAAQHCLCNIEHLISCEAKTQCRCEFVCVCVYALNLVNDAFEVVCNMQRKHFVSKIIMNKFLLLCAKPIIFTPRTHTRTKYCMQLDKKTEEDGRRKKTGQNINILLVSLYLHCVPPKWLLMLLSMALHSSHFRRVHLL